MPRLDDVLFVAIVLVLIVFGAGVVLSASRFNSMTGSNATNISTKESPQPTSSPALAPAIKHVTVVWTGDEWEVVRIDNNVTCYVRYAETPGRSTAISCVPDTYVGGASTHAGTGGF